MRKKSILFVCTGNIFRSFSAERALKKYLDVKAKDFIIASAGIQGKYHHHPDAFIVRELQKLGLDGENHAPQQVTNELLEKFDLLIAMSTDHQAILKADYRRDSVLFNQICFGVDDPLLDLGEAIPFEYLAGEQEAYAHDLIHYIHQSIPFLVKNLDRYFPSEKSRSNRKQH